MVDKSTVSRQEAKVRELDSKLEFEKTQVKRLEVSGHRRWRSASTGSRPRRRRAGELAPQQGSKVRLGRGKVILPDCTFAFLLLLAQKSLEMKIKDGFLAKFRARSSMVGTAQGPGHGPNGPSNSLVPRPLPGPTSKRLWDLTSVPDSS